MKVKKKVMMTTMIGILKGDLEHLQKRKGVREEVAVGVKVMKTRLKTGRVLTIRVILEGN